MIGVYRVQFAYPRLSEAQPADEKATAPICVACAAGHHEQIVLAGESCDCPCHGTPPEFTVYEVAV